MPDDVLSVSVGSVLRELTSAVEKGRGEVNAIVEDIRSFWDRSATADTALADDDSSAVLAQTERRLADLRADFEIARVATAMLRPSVELERQRYEGPTERLDGPGNTIGAFAETHERSTSAMSATTSRRISEIGETLRLTDPQAIERCVATQHYVDTRLREGWTFFVKRGRDRRAVVFPGQAAG